MAESTDTPAADEATGQGDQGEAPQGYCVELHVKADGTFTVEGPEPESEEQQEPSAAPAEGSAAPAEGEKSFPSLGEALKAVLEIVRQNPIGQSEQEGFEAGYASGPHRM